MRVLPRFSLPKSRSLRALSRHGRRHLSATRVVYFIESIVFVTTFSLAFTGNRLARLDSLGRRGDVLLASFLLALFVGLHVLIGRWLLPRIELYFSPAPYDGGRIFVDLGQGIRNVTSIHQLYDSISDRIRRSFEADNASILVRDEVSGDYRVRSYSRTSKPAVNVSDNRTDHQRESKLSADAFVVRRLSGFTTPLVIDPSDFKTWTLGLSFASQKSREARKNECETLLGIQSRLLVQIKRGDRMVGILSLGKRRAGIEYTVADKELLVSIAAQLAMVIENARLTDRIVAQERFQRELALAAEVQQRLLPGGPPAGISIELAGFCEPARGVGGDYYDFIAIDNDQVGIAIADVAGKGMPAALLMSTVQASLRSLTAGNGSAAVDEPPLAKMVGKLNRLIFNSTSG